MSSRKALTLIELILAIVLVTLVVMSVGISHSYFTKIIVSSIHQAILYQRTSFALELMKREMMTGKYISISDTVGARNLFIGKIDPGGNKYESVYYWDKASEELRYKANSTATPKLILPHVKTFTLAGVRPLCPTGFEGARITLEAEEPLKRTDKFSYLQSLAFCRLPSRPPTVPGFVQLRHGATISYYNTIQAAINAASTSSIDEVRCLGNTNDPCVFNGIFNENITIDRSIILRGSFDLAFGIQDYTNTPSTIDPQRNYNRVITCTGSSLTVTIDGFIIQNGFLLGSGAAGSGIYASCASSTILIANNTITGNSIGAVGDKFSHFGGGIYASGTSSTITITNNTIKGNSLSGKELYGGGIYAYSTGSSTILITKNNITGNSAGYWGKIGWVNKAAYGGGISAYCSGGAIFVKNNTITGNILSEAPDPVESPDYLTPQCYGGGIYASSTSSPIIIANNTIAGNSGWPVWTPQNSVFGAGIYASSPAAATVTNAIVYYNNNPGNIPNNIIPGNVGSVQYSDVGGGYSGNIDKTPVFASKFGILPDKVDYHLKPLPDNPNIINGGNPNSLYNDVDGSRNDMGAYGGPGAGVVGHQQ